MWDRIRASTVGELFSEFLGTMVLILFGLGATAVAVVGLPGSGRQEGAFGAGNWIIISWGWGLAVALAVYVAGGVSGAHINPAVTLGLAVRRGFPWHKVVPYWFAQVVGAFAGAAIVYGSYHSAIEAFEHTNHFSRNKDLGAFPVFATFPAEYFHGNWWGPFVDQVIGTALLVGVIAALLDLRNQAPKANMAPWMIGLVVAAIGFSWGTNAGYAINPARDFGPRLLTYAAGWGKVAFPGTAGNFSNFWWIPIAGPLVGGVIGIVLYDLFVGGVLAARSRRPSEPTPEPGRVPGSTEEPG